MSDERPTMKNDLTRRGFFGLGGAMVTLGFISWPFARKSLAPGDEILFNQVGFLAGGPKQLVVRSQGEVMTGKVGFDLMDFETKRLITRLSARVEPTSDPGLAVADVSDVRSSGTYYLRSGPVTSLPFHISAAPFEGVERALTRALYLQRCGLALDDPETGLSHGVCHGHDALGSRTKEPRNCVGGWHDAGDFGKYVATTSVVIGELLSLYEEDPARFRDEALGLPESGDGEPDLLSEMRVGLDWLLKMQRPWGAFERKVSGRAWPSMTDPPEADIQDRFAYGPSTADTAKAAAALAIAARVFRPFDEAASQTWLVAARRAWQFLERHPDMEIDTAPGDDNGSGNYLTLGPGSAGADQAARFWAALELYLTTGDEPHARAIRLQVSNMYVWPVSWSNPSMIGLMNFLRHETRPDIAGLRQEIEVRLVERASEYEKISQISPWGLASQSFGWGSNREVAARGRILAEAWRQTGKEKFRRAAVSQADYLLGRNPFGLSFVTGTGVMSVRNPHHRLDLAARARGRTDPIPGLLVGGPNGEAADRELALRPAYLRFRDDAASFETNEFAIDYNAALLSLLGRLTPPTRAAETGIVDRILRWLGL